ncbi:MAG: AbrB family transcriptional regulator [Piscirickettsiaceae bacterium]|nr:MAG: AbrB family transcriptional regulator [Piscirickettsiaceae bacterium]PCI65794.1 MAG: AbrB family transcriptional regulator [Piscirickettsiaceae bacterium]
MQTATSKLTKKYQATIPEPVRKLLNLKMGDEIAFDIENDGVHLRRARPVDIAFAESLENTLSEWTTKNDEEAYRDL